MPRTDDTRSRSQTKTEAVQNNTKIPMSNTSECSLAGAIASSDVTVYTVNETRLYKCPHVEMSISGEKVIGILDSGAEATLVAEQLFERLTSKGAQLLSIPAVNCTLRSAFGGRSKRIKLQALIEIKIGEVTFEKIVLIAPNLVTDMLIGSDFMDEYGVNIDFVNRCFEARVKGVVTSHKFYDRVAEWKETRGFIQRHNGEDESGTSGEENRLIEGDERGGSVLPAEGSQEQFMIEANCEAVSGNCDPDRHVNVSCQEPCELKDIFSAYGQNDLININRKGTCDYEGTDFAPQMISSVNEHSRLPHQEL